MQNIYISVGSNIDAHIHTPKGLYALQAAFGSITLSRIYESESVGFEGDNFTNLVVAAKTELNINQVCSLLKQVERDNGRSYGGKKFSSRTLDLDLLLYGNTVCENPIVLPREEILHNAFVLLPMSEVAPEEIHPVAQQSYAALWQKFDQNSQNLWAVEVTWSHPFK